MSTAQETLKQSLIQQSANGCGGSGCSYVFSPIDGCYHLQNSDCQTPCSCPPLICGLASKLLQLVHPESLGGQAAVRWPCLSGPALDGDEGSALVLCDLFAEQAAAVRFWKRVGIGLAIVSALLLAGLVVALFWRFG
jgi:hypothetical protein